MSGLIDRIRDWVASLFGTRPEESEADRESEETTGASHVCSICGTAVDDPAEGCPLCGSTDLERRDAGSGGGGDDRADDADDRAGDADDGSDGTDRAGDADESDDSEGERLPGDATATVRSSSNEDEAVDRLRALRDDGE